MDIVSLGYHGSLYRFSFQALDGTMLSTSLGRSIPVFPVRPSFCAYSLIVSTPSRSPTLKKYTLHDCSIASRRSREPCPSFLSPWTSCLSNTLLPLQVTRVSGVM